VFDVADGGVVYATGIKAQRDLAAVRRLIERAFRSIPPRSPIRRSR
jgi:hypothetical protein